ncbi:MAG: glycosyltransferase family 2 protein [Minisyncoccia bacterium]
MKKVSIIIPVLNEEGTIFEIIKRVKEADISGLEKEIIVVDNGSNDGTKKIVNSISGIRFLTEEIKGKGAAVKKGFSEATGDIFLIQDADLEYDPGDYNDVLQPILRGEAQMTNGVRIESRFHARDYISAGFLGFLGNSVITIVTNFLYNNHAKEYEGCYKAISKDLAQTVQCKSNGFEFENELICRLLKKGVKVVDVPIHYYPRSYSEGKKIKWSHGVKIVFTIIKVRFFEK